MQKNNLYDAYLSFGYTANEIEDFEKLMLLCETGSIANVTLAFQVGFLSEEPNRMFVDNFWNVLGVFSRDYSMNKNKSGFHFDKWIYEAIKNRCIDDISKYFEYIIDIDKIILDKPKKNTLPLDTRVFLCICNNYLSDIDFELNITRVLGSFFSEGNEGIFDFLVLPYNAKIHLDLRYDKYTPKSLIESICGKMGSNSSLSLNLLPNRNGLDLTNTLIKQVYCKDANLNECEWLFVSLLLPINLATFHFSMILDKSKQYRLSDVEMFLNRVYNSLLFRDKLEKISYNFYENVGCERKALDNMMYDVYDRPIKSSKYVLADTMKRMNKFLA